MKTSPMWKARSTRFTDAETVETELMISDMESLERRAANLRKRGQTGDKEAKAQVELMDRILELLHDGKPGRMLDVADEEERKAVRGPQPAHHQTGALYLQRG